MTLGELVLAAVDSEDCRAAGRVADHMRAQGHTYKDVLAFAEHVARKHGRQWPGAAWWDGLLYECDQAESGMLPQER